MTKEEKRQLLMIIDKVFIEQKINAYTNKRDGWIPESAEYAAYDLVIREYKCVMSQLMPLPTLPDEGEKQEIDTNQISDGYHTFGELYEHRITLYIALCKIISIKYGTNMIWRSKKHSDENVWDGWFILGIFTEHGKQITYHLPISKWEDTDFAMTLPKAPEWDEHTSNDVLNRIKLLTP